jgi:hypothetical protein
MSAALKIVPKDSESPMTQEQIDDKFRDPSKRGVSNWQERQDEHLNRMQTLVSFLEYQFLTATGKERAALQELLSIYYQKINELVNPRTELLTIQSIINYDEFSI